ncbi:MAG: PilW family protein [Halofilum sp. (in: g-proteobacteria)]|nr:PilW family protein [Halofilum sp. (in: g-proteobacteria)]
MNPMYTRHDASAAKSRRQSGLTMVEVMIALAIGLILTLGAVQIFVSSKQGYRANEALARIQENGRYALHFLKQDIRSAAFWGCAQEVEVNNVVNGGATGINFNGEPIEGGDGGAGNPDSITLRMANQNSGVNVAQPMPTVAANLFLTATDEFQEGDILIVTDCESAEIFMITTNNTNNDNLQHNGGVNINGISNTTQNFSKQYTTDAIAYTATETTYQINNNGLQRVINGSASRLVDDIVGLQLTYGVDTDNNEVPDAYLTATEVDANAAYTWSEVHAVRIQLLARSREDNIVDAPQAQAWDFDGDGTLDTAPDRRMYQQFTTTVGVRNRLP